MLVIEVAWWDPSPPPPHHASCHLAFFPNGTVEVAANDTAIIPLAKWDETRDGIISSGYMSVRTIYSGTPLAKSFAHERLANPGAFVALHVLAPTTADLAAWEPLVGDALDTLLGDKVLFDRQPAKNRVYIIPKTFEAEHGDALRELYQVERLHRLIVRRHPDHPRQQGGEWSAYFAPFHGAGFAVSDVSSEANEVSGMLKTMSASRSVAV
jgi:hypothetical protein